VKRFLFRRKRRRGDNGRRDQPSGFLYLAEVVGNREVLPSGAVYERQRDGSLRRITTQGGMKT